MPLIPGLVLRAALIIASPPSEAIFIPADAPADAAYATSDPPDLSTPLHPSPDLVSGHLDNGVRFLVLRNANPPGKAVVWLHVGAGCLNDPPDKRGIAHFLEHMAFEGSENFPPGSFEPLLESLELTPSPHGFSSTGYDMTSYELTIPDTQPATFDTALLFLADVAGRLTFPAERVDQRRDLLLRELRLGLSPETRLADKILPAVAPGSLLATRSIVGDPRAIASISREDLDAFYTRWYAPSNMSVIVVGDAEPAVMVERIRLAFGVLPARAGAARPDPGVSASRGVNAVVASDREVEGASVILSRIGPAGAPAMNVGDWRRQFIDRIAVRAFDRRLDEAVALNRVRIRSADARAGQIGSIAHRAEVQASGPVGDWGAMLLDLISETRRARADGFQPAEIDLARRDMLAIAERSAQAQVVRPAAQVVRLIDGAVGAGEPFMSPAQELELGTALLPGITDAEVNAAFAALFDPDNSTVVLTLPSGVEPVSEQDVLAAATGKPAAAAGPVTAPRPRSILGTLPPDGEVAESDRHVGSSVLNLRFANNVVVHFRLMEHRHETVTISALIPGGELRETGATRGLTRAAAEAFRAPATPTLSADEMASILLDRGITCSAEVFPDSLGFSISGSPEQIEAAFQLAHAMLTEPSLPDAAVQNWKSRQDLALAGLRSQPDGAFAVLMLETMYPQRELRTRPLAKDEVDAVTPGAARDWLADALRGPIEISIVGKLDEARAAKLAARYFGSLPARPLITTGAFDPLRKLPAPAGVHEATKSMEAKEALGRLAVGFYGPDESGVQDLRLLRVAVRALNTRVQRTLRDDQKLAKSIAIGVSPGVAYPGYGLVYAAATCDPKDAPRLTDAIEAALAEFARSGPTTEEFKAARQSVSNDISTEILEPQFWTQQLRDLNYHGKSLDAIVAAPDAVNSCTPEDVRAAFARYHDAGPALRVVLLAAPHSAPAK